MFQQLVDEVLKSLMAGGIPLLLGLVVAVVGLLLIFGAAEEKG